MNGLEVDLMRRRIRVVDPILLKVLKCWRSKRRNIIFIKVYSILIRFSLIFLYNLKLIQSFLLFCFLERTSSYIFLFKHNSVQVQKQLTPVRWMQHSSLLLGERTMKNNMPGTSQESGYQAMRLATELFPATFAMIGAKNISPFWSVLFYFVLIMFGIGQQVSYEYKYIKQNHSLWHIDTIMPVHNILYFMNMLLLFSVNIHCCDNNLFFRSQYGTAWWVESYPYIRSNWENGVRQSRFWRAQLLFRSAFLWRLK